LLPLTPRRDISDQINRKAAGNAAAAHPQPTRGPGECRELPQRGSGRSSSS